MRAGVGNCQDNLLARSRLGPLSAVERRALDAHLGVCELCRAAVAFGALFDAIPDQPAAQDDALVRRLADRMASGGRERGPRRRPWVLALAAGIALFVVAGAAAAWVSARRQPQAPPPVPSVLAAPAPRAAHTARGFSATAEAPVSPAIAPTGEAPPSALRTTPARGRPRPDQAKSSTVTAADLFARANSTRRLRNFREAIQQYQTLQRLFPESSEARVSLVSTGDLLSRAGEPASALTAFDRYLSDSNAGALAPEALVGRARCLERLSRRTDELAAWRELLRRFPGSIYEALALRRVDELSR